MPAPGAPAQIRARQKTKSPEKNKDLRSLRASGILLYQATSLAPSLAKQMCIGSHHSAQFFARSSHSVNRSLLARAAASIPVEESPLLRQNIFRCSKRISIRTVPSCTYAICLSLLLSIIFFLECTILFFAASPAVLRIVTARLRSLFTLRLSSAAHPNDCSQNQSLHLWMEDTLCIHSVTVHPVLMENRSFIRFAGT